MSLTQWIDPTGATWVVDYAFPSCIGLVKEVLEHHLQNKIWHVSRCSGTAGSRATAAQYSLNEPHAGNVDNSGVVLPERNLAPGAITC